MPMPLYTVTYRVPGPQVTATLSQLAVFLLQASYAFLQTFHSAGHAEIDIFAHQQPILRVVLHQDAGHEPPAFLPSPTPQSVLSSEVVTLVHALAQLWDTASPLLTSPDHPR